MNRVVIIGGGASGALTAAHLLRFAPEGVEVVVVERAGTLGKGVAYGTTQMVHLLNVRAKDMSAYPDDPGHFQRWAATHRACDRESVGDAFLPRRVYHWYLRDVLADSARQSKSRLLQVQGEAVALEASDDGLRLELAEGPTIRARRAVLALGNLPPRLPEGLRPVARDPRLVVNPWRAETLEQVDPEATVLLVGTGLTMVDTVLSLVEAGHRGKIVAVSRNGLLPRSHVDGSGKCAPDIENLPPRLVPFLRALRRGSKSAGWRETIDGMRPFTQAVWGAMSWEERGRFLSRLQTFWDVHRHRIAPEIAAVLERKLSDGTLEIVPGGVLGASSEVSGIRVRLRDRSLLADLVVNCTGPETRYARVALPLLESAAQAGLVEYDPLGMGLMVDVSGRSARDPRVFGLGPVCRGCRWETTAIPEIRVQAAQVAAAIAEDFAGSRSADEDAPSGAFI